MKYHAHIEIDWDFNSNLPYNEIIARFNKEFSKYGEPAINIHPLIKNDKVQIAEFSLTEVMQYISNKNIKRDFKCGSEIYSVKMNSQRLFLFRESCKCAACGIEGSKFILEYHVADKTPHFNLYAEENGQLVLFTRDHIKPKAVGGADQHSNYQTMCSICNNLKGHSNIHLHEIKTLRKFYNNHRNKLGKKKFHLLLESKKKSFQAKKIKFTSKENLQKEFVVLNTDLNLFQLHNKYFCLPLYDGPHEKATRIGCIKKNTKLEPVLVIKKTYFCKLNNDICAEIKSSFLRN
jgi:hypothetical protein